MHETWEFSARWMHHEVPMIRHDTVREQWDWHTFECLDENSLKGFIVPLIEEQLMPANRPIVNV